MKPETRDIRNLTLKYAFFQAFCCAVSYHLVSAFSLGWREHSLSTAFGALIAGLFFTFPFFFITSYTIGLIPSAICGFYLATRATLEKRFYRSLYYLLALASYAVPFLFFHPSSGPFLSQPIWFVFAILASTFFSLHYFTKELLSTPFALRFKGESA